MKTVANFRCKECDDIFWAESGKWTKCKCGKCEVEPLEMGSTAYRGKQCFERLKDGEDHTYYDESDFYIMEGEVLDLFNKMKQMCEELDFHIYESFKKSEDGDEYLSYINYTNSDLINHNEMNEVQFCVRFDKYFNAGDYIGRLNSFYEFLLYLKNNPELLKKRKELLDYSYKNDVEWDRKQVKDYDYTFYF
ncbi:hypothetical protein SAMN05443270_3106 [Lacrimispora sphenoides]|uniref:hypothetical protein n=1 Tax=Lacrimispora sphenoides TaxID=29370 RepID=UPI0008C92953|nr:hypothetical protein [Lacrimispora sphenoides]SEU09560.1 hypothetical protein SAMN05443270_3106 [Lacrimispora sphenoides]